MEQKPPGRIVLVYFGNPDDAERFLHNTSERVVAMYEDPKGKECQCKSQRRDTRAKEFGWGEQHPYWGWMRHGMCGRAGVWWRRNYGRRLFLALGVNIIRDRAPEIFKGPEGWGHENYRPTSEDGI
jgi:hypothetical protein